MGTYNNIPNKESIELLDQFKLSGDSSDLAKLYKHYMEMVLAVGLKYFRNKHQAEDLVMNVYEILYKKAANHQVSNVSSWIYTIAKNECLMELRKKRREIPSDSINYQQQVVESEAVFHLFGEKDSDQEMAQLNDCIQQLSKDQKECIELFYLKQNSYKDIEEHTNYTMKQVKSFIQNGKRNLKNCMESKQ